MSKSIIPKTAVMSPEDFRRELELSDEKQKELRLEQDRLLAKFRSRARLNPDERQKARGIELERHHRRTGNKDALAEAFAMQGRYKEAIAVVVREDLKEVLQTQLEAVGKDDVNCGCDDFREENGAFLPNLWVESYGYSEKHRKTMPFIRCAVCGELNARPMPAHLAAQQQVRQESVKKNAEIMTAQAFFTNGRT